MTRPMVIPGAGVLRAGVLRAGVLSMVMLCAAGCAGLANVPLPGGADTGTNPYRITAEFSDVLELVPQSLVKVNDVSVGAVREIRLAPESWHAIVTLELNRSVELPANAIARVRTTSLLGEKFVDLAAPAGEPAVGRLADGARIPISRTSRATDVEEVLGALSLLLNGGGVDQIRTIARELNEALSGHEPQLRMLLGDLNTLSTGLNERKAEINRALDALNRLSATLTRQRGQITTALDGLPPGLKVLADQRAQLTGTLVALDRLSAVATGTINRSRDDLVADLKLLQPTLTQLANAGADLPNALGLIATYPFTDGAAREAFQGDYSNLYVRADLNLGTVLDNLASSGQPLMGVPPPLGQPLAPGSPPLGPLVSGLSGLIPPPPSAAGGPYGPDPQGGGMGAVLAPLLRSPRGGPA
ncbi:MAG TPA: MCE family protein [Pseudonocardiaceae bacterium]|nr:MCE family protein [Pseudonocardiaceae bacterium]